MLCSKGTVNGAPASRCGARGVPRPRAGGGETLADGESARLLAREQVESVHRCTRRKQKHVQLHGLPVLLPRRIQSCGSDAGAG